MTKVAVGRLITYLSDNFKNFERPSKEAAEIWVDALEDKSREDVNYAINEHIKTSAFPIHLSDILKNLPKHDDPFKGKTDEQIRSEVNAKTLKRWADYEKAKSESERGLK